MRLRLRLISPAILKFTQPPAMLPGETHYLGRSSDCSIVIKEGSISRIHAELKINENSLLVKDQRSLNGIFVDDNKIHELEWHPGQMLVFGKVRIRLAKEELPVPLLEEEMSELSTYTVKDKYLLYPHVLQLLSAEELERLSAAELRVLELLFCGLTEKTAAAKLHNSIHTIHNHVRKIYRHLGVKSRVQLMAKYFSAGKVPDKQSP